MEIYFKNKKLEKLCNNPAKLVKAMGAERAENKLSRQIKNIELWQQLFRNPLLHG